MSKFYGRKRWAYYSRNDSYSKSANAENAEANGRFPKTRAAKELGVSSEAFIQGLVEANYHSNEYHHVGKYATPVTYYDTNEIKNLWKFWFGVSKCYKSQKVKNEFLRKAAQLRLSEIKQNIQNNKHNKNKYKRQQELYEKFKLNQYGIDSIYDFEWPKTLTEWAVSNCLPLEKMMFAA